MSFLCSPLTLINPLHRERCIASSPHGGGCPKSIDFTKRVSADRELALSKQMSNPKTRAINLRNAARLMTCDNHGKEARRIARLWEEHSNPTLSYIPSPAQKSRHTSSLHNRRNRQNVELCAGR
ncbi:hypothetical protein BJX63DRAFT_426681 [Aspergillus granulosus]|uniref:Uncharacterized protein n=1 Tax=Aspergillus granulosus TaxID=176169 RepID=A0ABR4GQZ5_9EURO